MATRTSGASGVAWLLILGGLTCGCGTSSPQAPALRDGPVYQSDAAGLRFLVPEHWKQTASSALPTGPLDREVLLTRYRLPTSAQGASLEVIAMDASKDFDPLAYHCEPSFGIENWEIAESPRSTTIGGSPATRFLLQGSRNQAVLAKEVVAFQRGSRWFHFIALMAPSDIDARQQIQRAIQSIAWRD